MKGSTSDFAELVVDYENGTTDIKGVPEDNFKNNISTAFIDWAKFIGIWLGIPYLIIFFFVDKYLDVSVNMLNLKSIR